MIGEKIDANPDKVSLLLRASMPTSSTPSPCHRIIRPTSRKTSSMNSLTEWLSPVASTSSSG
jgi:hypothetical protein